MWDEQTEGLCPVEGPETLFQQVSPAVSPTSSWNHPAEIGEGAGAQRTLGCRPWSLLGVHSSPCLGLFRSVP